jgi:hypothetical protein
MASLIGEIACVRGGSFLTGSNDFYAEERPKHDVRAWVLVLAALLLTGVGRLPADAIGPTLTPSLETAPSVGQRAARSRQP